MFAPRYFAKGYFAPRYFPPVTEVGPEPEPPRREGGALWQQLQKVPDVPVKVRPNDDEEVLLNAIKTFVHYL